MPPKKAAAAPATAATGQVDDAQRNKDAVFIFDSMFNVANNIVFNAAEIAEKTGGKANTVAKRFSTIRQRYPGLKISTTTTASTGGDGGTTVAVPPTPKARRSSAATTAAKPRGRKPAAAKPAKKVDDEASDDEDDPEVDDAEVKVKEASTDEIDDKTGAPPTPADSVTDTNLADDEKSVKRPAKTGSGTTSNKGKGKGTNTTADKKRKRDAESPTPAAIAKKTKVANRPKNAGKANAKTSAKKEVKAEEDGIQADEAGEEGQDDGKQSPSTDTNAKAESDRRLREQAEATEMVNMLASKSRRSAISMSPQNPKRVQGNLQPYVEDATDGGDTPSPGRKMQTHPAFIVPDLRSNDDHVPGNASTGIPVAS